MKNGKMLILTILAALSFQAEAQRGVFVHEAYNSVRKYIHPLRLSQAQVIDWSALNRHFDEQIYLVRNDRYLSQRMRSRRLQHLYNRKNHGLRNILSRRQYDKYRYIRSRRDRDRRNYRGNNRYRGSASNCSVRNGYNTF